MNDKTNNKSPDFAGDEPIVGISPTVKRLRIAVERLSKVSHNLLIVGEPGSGRKFFAQKIFNQSKAYSKALVCIDCAMLGKTLQFNDLYGEIAEDQAAYHNSIGLLEKANDGLLLVENLGSMNYEYQDEFLRILRDKTIRKVGDKKNITLNIRVISTAENDILDKVETGTIRRDLYMLLSTIVIVIPPLRERKQDIPSLFSYFQKKFSEETGVEHAPLPEDVFSSILAYNWKGNIGELKESIKNTVTMSPTGSLSAEFLPFRIKKHPYECFECQQFKSIISRVQAFLINKALRKTDGHLSDAAKMLGLSAHHLKLKMNKFHISRK